MVFSGRMFANHKFFSYNNWFQKALRVSITVSIKIGLRNLKISSAKMSDCTHGSGIFSDKAHRNFYSRNRSLCYNLTGLLGTLSNESYFLKNVNHLGNGNLSILEYGLAGY